MYIYPILVKYNSSEKDIIIIDNLSPWRLLEACKR